MDPKTELRALLLDEKRSIDRLLERVDDPGVSLVELVELVEAMERVAEQKSPVIRLLREQASERRKREEERSVRQFVLRALEFIGAPQPAGFLQEFVWARERVDLNTRGFGALRRDEARAWRRRPGHRVAYIVPALDPDGHALARWMARSDWPLCERLVVSGADRLFALKGVVSLFCARDESPSIELSDPYLPLIKRYVAESSGIEAPPVGSKSNETAWLLATRNTIETELRQVEESVRGARRQVEKKIGVLAEEQQLWGR